MYNSSLGPNVRHFSQQIIQFKRSLYLGPDCGTVALLEDGRIYRLLRKRAQIRPQANIHKKYKNSGKLTNTHDENIGLFIFVRDTIENYE